MPRPARLSLCLLLALSPAACVQDLDDSAPRATDHYADRGQELSCGPPESCVAPDCGPEGEVVDGPCCSVCAADAGETCGGPWGLSGTCGTGLTCALFDETDPDSEGECVSSGDGGLCADWHYQICFEHAECGEGYFCSPPVAGCLPSRCLCDPETGGSAGCSADCHSGAGLCEPVEDCFCTLEYDPVCGVDGLTYGNACAAACARAEIDYDGECLGQIGDACGTADVAACRSDLICLGGQPELELPGTCVQAPLCEDVEDLFIRCQRDKVIVHGFAPSLAGLPLYLDINGSDLETLVAGNGIFSRRVRPVDGLNSAQILGCVEHFSVSCTY